jgi:hypothetical protein
MTVKPLLNAQSQSERIGAVASVGKEKHVGVMMSRKEYAELRRAARLVTEQRHERVPPSVLLREIGMAGVEKILNEAETTNRLPQTVGA